MIGRAMMAAGLAALWAAAPAHAADNAMQVCSGKYQAAKKAGQLPAGQTWNQFLASCRAGLGKPATAAAAVPPVAVTPSGKPAAAAGAKTPTANQLAARDRERKCGAMWKADKAAGKVAAGQTWPKYYSACNAKLKG